MKDAARRQTFSVVLMAAGAGSFLLAGVLAAGPATAAKLPAAAAPPGNNGTIKINDIPFEGEPGNQPHVSCPFRLSLIGFDHGAGITNSATVVFDAQPPSGHSVLPPSEGASSFTFPGPNFNDVYSFAPETLAPLFLEPNQGYHIKVTVSVTTAGLKTPGVKTTRSKVTKKFKVFWLQCAAISPSPTPTQTGSVSPTPTTTVTGSVSPTPTTTVTGSVSPTATVTGSVSPSETPTSPGATVLPTETSRAPSPGTTVLPTRASRSPLPFTGARAGNVGVLVAMAFGFVLSGTGLVGLTRRRHAGNHR